jgi:hypothetical protein
MWPLLSLVVARGSVGLPDCGYGGYRRLRLSCAYSAYGFNYVDYHTRQAFAHALGSSILLGSAYAGDAGECHSLVRAWRRCTGVNPGLLAMVCNGGLFGGHMPLLAYSELKQSSESVIERDCSGDKLRTRGGLPGAERIQFERGLSLSVIAASLGGS